MKNVWEYVKRIFHEGESLTFLPFWFFGSLGTLAGVSLFEFSLWESCNILLLVLLVSGYRVWQRDHGARSKQEFDIDLDISGLETTNKDDIAKARSAIQDVNNKMISLPQIVSSSVGGLFGNMKRVYEIFLQKAEEHDGAAAKYRAVKIRIRNRGGVIAESVRVNVSVENGEILTMDNESEWRLVSDGPPPFPTHEDIFRIGGTHFLRGIDFSPKNKNVDIDEYQPSGFRARIGLLHTGDTEFVSEEYVTVGSKIVFTITAKDMAHEQRIGKIVK